MAESPQIKILEEQIRECFVRVVWRHKTHEKCADILNKKNSRIKVLQIVLSGLTTTGIFVTILGESKTAAIIAGVLSLATLILNSYLKKYDLGKIAQKHSDAALDVWRIREEYFSLLIDIRTDCLLLDEIRKEREKLQQDLYKVYKGSPRTFTQAYIEATKALTEMEELTFSDEEINKFLPNSLKI